MNLFHVGVVLDYETGMASKAIYAISGMVMKGTLEKPRAACKVAFRSMTKRTFGVASKQDGSSIYSNQAIIKVLQASE